MELNMLKISGHVADVIHSNDHHMDSAMQGFERTIEALEKNIRAQNRAVNEYVKDKSSAREALRAAQQELEENSDALAEKNEKNSDALTAAK